MGGLDDAIEWATETRLARRRFVEAIGEQGLRPVDVARLVEDAPEAIRTLRLLPCVEAMPAAGGKVAARRAITAAGLDERTPIGEISEGRWRSLDERLGGRDE